MHAKLIRDELNWSYVSPLTGQLTYRRLRVYGDKRDINDVGVLTCVVTERGPGTSITHAVTAVLFALRDDYPYRELSVIEHYPAGVGIDVSEHFDEVIVFKGGVRWQRVPNELIESIFGPEIFDNKDKAVMS